MRHAGTGLGFQDALLFGLVLLAFLTATRMHIVLSPELTPLVQIVVFVAVALLLTASALRRGIARGSFLAYTDELTGLRNRRSFTERLADRLVTYRGRQPKPALLLLDLDRFKQVNDTLGHPAGDELLRVVAGRLVSAVPEDCFVGRLGGDEFAVIASVRSAPEALMVADEILKTLNQPVTLKGHEIWPNTSIGVALPGTKRIPPSELLSMADDALYQAKARGKGRAFLFDTNASMPALDKLSLESELHLALKDQHFEMLYQPVMGLGDRRIVGLEALLRWNHPVQGVLTPEAFLAVADETGIGQSLSRWVFETVSTQSEIWRDLFGERVSVSINVSPAAFRSPDFVYTVGRVARDNADRVVSLQFEVPESLLAEDDESAKENLAALRQMGFRIAIDDFGVGFSSLNYLQTNRLDVLKLAPAFVRAADDNDRTCRIVRSIVDLAHLLDMTVVAEGIETEEQYLRMLETGCDFGQGYYFARPMRPLELTELLANNEMILPDGSAVERRGRGRAWARRRLGSLWRQEMPEERGA